MRKVPMQLSKNKGRIKLNMVILAFIASWVIAMVALNGCNAGQNEKARLIEEVNNLKKQLNNMEEDLRKKDEDLKRKDNTIKKQYKESLRKYANEYRDRMATANYSINEYREFLIWGRPEYRERFEEERQSRFNEVKGKLDAVVDHVERYRPILEPFERTLNGRLNRLRIQINENDEEVILREFNALNEGVESQIGALEVQINRLRD